jgi:hypothetical protein
VVSAYKERDAFVEERVYYYFRFSSVRVFVDEDDDENVLAKSIIIVIIRGNDQNAIGFFVSSQWEEEY